MDGIMKRIAVAVLLLVLLGVAACGDERPAPPAVEVRESTKASPTQEVEPGLRGTFARRIAATHARYERAFAADRKRASRRMQAAASRVAELEDELARRRGEPGEPRDRLERARDELERAEFVHRWVHDPWPGSMGGRPCHVGKIVRSDSESKVYWISLGRADGVHREVRYVVSRGNDYIGTIRIYQVMEQQSAGCAVGELPRSQIQLGDKVVSE